MTGARKVLHVEVGGSYGGSLRALETYLAHSNRHRFVHDLLLYHETPGADRLRPLLRDIFILRPGVTAATDGLRSRNGLLGNLWSMAAATPLPDVKQLLVSLPTARAINRVIQATPHDAVHVNNTFAWQVPTLLAARWARKPVLAHVRNPVPDSVLNRRIARLAAVIVTIHQAQKAQIKSWKLPGQVTTCYDGVAYSPADRATASALRASLVPPDGVLIGSVGRLTIQKGYDILARAARRVCDLHPRVRFAVVADGPLRADLSALITQLGIADRFHLCGFQQDPTAFLAAIDIFVSSSRWEGLPLVVVEAMLQGKPVVATNVGGNSEIVKTGSTGTLVPPEDPNALANALLAMLDSQRLLSFSADTIRRTALDTFDPVASARTFDDVIDRLLSGNDVNTRTFYEHVYSTGRWRRPASGIQDDPSRFSKMWYRALLDYVLPNMDLSRKRVLEVGCGYGYLVPALCSSGAHYVGVDISLNAVRQFPTSEHEHAYPLVADASMLPLASASFDVVICMEVLEHATNPQTLLDECFRVVKAGGTLIFTCPNYLNFFFVPKVLANMGIPFFCRYMTHQVVDRTMTAFTLRRWLRSRGHVRLQRAIRLHPPFFEQLDYRLRDGHPLRRINDFVFALEKRFGDVPPTSFLGLHTLYVVEPLSSAPPSALTSPIRRNS
jgi:glycosyltransferase involved in cell wall biosynthesis/SAM-dependent methyltransferase